MMTYYKELNLRARCKKEIIENENRMTFLSKYVGDE